MTTNNYRVPVEFAAENEEEARQIAHILATHIATFRGTTNQYQLAPGLMFGVASKELQRQRTFWEKVTEPPTD